MLYRQLLPLALVVFFAAASLGQIPNVYEFCSALMTDKTTGHSTACPRGHCQGRMGKRGPPGIRGPPGVKGDKGEQGTCEGLEERQRLFEEKLQQKFDLIPKTLYCGMGMASGEIQDYAITASSKHIPAFAAPYGRLNERHGFDEKSAHGHNSFAVWCPASTSNQWIQVDLGKSKSIAGVVTQGRPLNQWGWRNWVKTFKITCGASVGGLQPVRENGSDKVFEGNTDENSKVTNKFSSPITCRFVRLYPLTWNTDTGWVRPCLRMELLRGDCFDLL